MKVLAYKETVEEDKQILSECIDLVNATIDKVFELSNDIQQQLNLETDVVDYLYTMYDELKNFKNSMFRRIK